MTQKRRLNTATPKRRTFATTEYWTYIIAGMVMFYMDMKGISMSEVKESVNGFLVKMDSYIESAKYLIIPILISFKKGLLTWKSITEEAKVAIALAKNTIDDVTCDAEENK